ncbi:MAG: 6,7-dimethyl-8-ribityllumazine synthase [Pseudolabrys sp.]|nr:6,7-dimethyl-8-ribityllumazine synthase [Pseudolabrys sp.]
MAKKVSAAAPRAPKSQPSKSSGPRLLIVEARYYQHIADALLKGASAVLDEAGATYDRITVPGALEIPGAIAMAADAPKNKKTPYDGYVALGCVIQGETYHFEIVSNESARGLMDLTVARQIAIGNGILTVDTEAQAQARIGGAHGHKGKEAAKAALAMVALKQSLTSK